MARGGASVGVNDLGGSQDGEGRDVGPAEEVVAEIRAAGGQAIVNAADISDPAAAASIVEDALGAFGKLDAVVNNAGILRDRIFHRSEEHTSELQSLIRISYAVFCLKKKKYNIQSQTHIIKETKT